jgi:hypothetical protein
MHKDMTQSKMAPETEPIKLDLAEAVDSFSELYELLEEYGPRWYSEDVHDRAQSALILLRASLGVEPPLKSSSRKQKSLEYSVRNS